MGRRGHPWESLTTATAAPGQLVVGTQESAQGDTGFEPGMRIGRYEVMELVGEGGMGMVYRARDTELAREVALKRIDPGRLGLDESRARLRREAQAMARVDHPSVVRIYDVGDVAMDGGHLFVAMELVSGGTLTQWLKQKPRSWREILDVLIAAGHGIAAAHRAGLVHRDIKPGNILVDERGTAKVTDFGLARTPDEKGQGTPPSEAELLSGNITRTGVVAGTPAYMAPEQIAGEPVDARADQFSFCVALWEALCGSRPFRVQEEPTSVQKALLRAITDGDVTQPDENVRVPRRILAAVRRGLAGDPALRWPSMDALLAALERDVRPYHGAVMPALVGVVLVGAAVGAMFFRNAASPEPMLQPESAAETVAHTSEEQMTVVVLRDGRFLKMERGELLVSGEESNLARQLARPQGHRPVVTRGASCSGSALVYTAGEICRWWRVPLSGNPWQPLADDPGCARHVEVDVSADGKQVAIVGERGVVIRDLTSGAERVVSSVPIIASEVSWSPDGQRLAVEIDQRIAVIDLKKGTRQDFGGFGQEPTWLDSHRFFYSAAFNWTRSEIRLRDLRTGEFTVAASLDGQVGDLSLGPEGLLALAQSSFPKLYTASTNRDRPFSVSELTSVYTGATLDFEPVTWTLEGALISTARINRLRALMETRPGMRGVPLVQRKVDGMFHAGTSVGNILFGLGQNGKFTLYSFDVATRQERVWKEVGYDGIPQLDCARRVPRCRLRGAPDRWFDPITLTVGAETPRMDPDERLSPDGTETVRLRGTTVVIRALNDDAETVITPQPAISGPIRVIWGGDAHTLLVFASRSEQNLREIGYHRLLRLERDGSWRAIIEDSGHTISRALLSEDGSQVAFTAQRTESTWKHLPYTRAMEKTVKAALAEAYAAAHQQP